MWSSALIGMQKVQDALPRFMYLQNGTVYTARGYQIDPIQDALKLEWIAPNDMFRQEANPYGYRVATEDEVRATWASVKDSDLSSLQMFEALTKLRLSDAESGRLVDFQVQDVISAIKAKVPAFNSFPADAQLATVLRGWLQANQGTVTTQNDSAFFSALNSKNFTAANMESVWPSETQAQQFTIANLFSNAQAVLDQKLDPSVLVWPKFLDRVFPSSVTTPRPTKAILEDDGWTTEGVLTGAAKIGAFGYLMKVAYDFLVKRI